MTVLAAEAVIGLALLALLGTLIVLLMRRRRAAPRLAMDKAEKTTELVAVEPQAPARRRTFGPAAEAPVESPNDSPNLPRFVTAARTQTIAGDSEQSPPPFQPTETDLPPPPASPFVAEALKQAIVLRQIFPPDAPGARSFYGGVPQVPTLFNWPRSLHSGLPLHFLLQVDCAAIAPEARLGLMPPAGALLFFADLARTPSPETGIEGKVLWLDETDDTAWGEVDPPDDLPPAHGDDAASVWPWARDAGDAPQVLPRWPFVPILIGLTAAASVESRPLQTWPEGPATADALLAAQGAPVAVFALSPNDFNTGQDGLLHRPWAGFPHDWLAVQTLSAMLAREAARAARLHDRTHWPELSAEDRHALLTRIESECDEWHELARTKAAFADVTEPVRQAFWEWFSDYAPLARLVAPRGCAASVETTLHALPSSASQFPEDLLARLAYRHALAVRTAARVHARVPDRLLAAPSQTEADLSSRSARELLLLELSTDEALGHHLGDLVLQFWITPEALAERRMDAAQVLVAPV